MATTARQTKPPRKAIPEPPVRRAPAWTGARASPTFSPATPNVRVPNGSQPASAGAFPPLAQTNGVRSTDNSHERILQQLSGLTGTTVTVSTKTNQRYEGVVASTGTEGDTTGVTLKDVRDISIPGAPIRDQVFIAATNIDQWSSGPADAKAPNGDSFKTDTDISQGQRRERELQAWQPTVDENGTATVTVAATRHVDEVTFGPGASGANGFDEDAYTTKLDRNAPDFKERERKALQLANEIMGSSTTNVHIAEERVMNLANDNSTNEEDKYGAVVRGANAYVPPGARKTNATTSSPVKPDLPKVSINAPDGSSVPAPQTSTPTPPKAASPAPSSSSAANRPAADPIPAFRDFVSTEKDRLMKKKQALMKNEMDKRKAELLKFSQSFKLNKPIPEDLVPILAKDAEKQRQIKEKSSKDAQSSHARAIGVATTTVLAPATAVRPSAPPTSKAAPETTRQSVAKTSAGAPMAKTATAPAKPGAEPGSKRITMFIQPIPPFKGKRSSTTGTAGAPPSVSGPARQVSSIASPLSPAAANRLNVNASSFRPTATKSSSFSPGGSPNPNSTSSSSASPKNKSAESVSPQGPPNPFFGTRLIKKGPPVHIKDDFNPFKYHKVAEASAVSAIWPYSGKRYMQMFPQLPTQPQQQSPHMAPPVPPPPMPPPSYEEDSAAQAAARGYVYAYPPYGYPGQPMMPGMPPPPGAYIPGPYMQPMPYPMPPPNGIISPQNFQVKYLTSFAISAMYPSTPMGQMPRELRTLITASIHASSPSAWHVSSPSKWCRSPAIHPPTPIPAHAHPYYHQSPQRMLSYQLVPFGQPMTDAHPTVQHAVPYPMMMPPPGQGVPPHPYEAAQAPPVPMGGVGHA
ncbi:Uncharacterized protein C21B10.03c [Grifola frondosa]|uniref:Uncharacterized protein C21B10.03c n=1 Tax=Grifola frondosa TaxID=5627 RepID=A0A1C7M7E0_GRIFR|nr:Uncharacterized protein C21B10.03c [Grifola frondosa]